MLQPSQVTHLYHSPELRGIKFHHNSIVFSHDVSVAVYSSKLATHKPGASPADFDHRAAHTGMQAVDVTGGKPAVGLEGFEGV